jgi:hypothetical protein
MDNAATTKPKILVTGSRGRLGSLIAKGLADEFDVFSVDRGPSHGDPHYRQADITDFAQVLPLMEEMDAVVHMAAASGWALDQSHDPASVSEFDRLTLRVNVEGTFNIFEAARRAGVRRVVYTSSMTTIYGDRHRPRYDETTPPDPTNLYACTKIFGENLARTYWRNHGLSAISLRVGQPFPIGYELDDIWWTNVRARSIFVAVEDVLLAVRCALKTEVQHGVYPVISASDNQRFDITLSQEIGYRPRAYLSSEGLCWLEEGCAPPASGPVVTHNPEDLA